MRINKRTLFSSVAAAVITVAGIGHNAARLLATEIVADTLFPKR